MVFSAPTNLWQSFNISDVLDRLNLPDEAKVFVFSMVDEYETQIKSILDQKQEAKWREKQLSELFAKEEPAFIDNDEWW